jgi:hypothetical protein
MGKRRGRTTLHQPQARTQPGTPTRVHGSTGLVGGWVGGGGGAIPCHGLPVAHDTKCEVAQGKQHLADDRAGARTRAQAGTRWSCLQWPHTLRELHSAPTLRELELHSVRGVPWMPVGLPQHERV